VYWSIRLNPLSSFARELERRHRTIHGFLIRNKIYFPDKNWGGNTQNNRMLKNSQLICSSAQRDFKTAVCLSFPPFPGPLRMFLSLCLSSCSACCFDCAKARKRGVGALQVSKAMKRLTLTDTTPKRENVRAADWGCRGSCTRKITPPPPSLLLSFSIWFSAGGENVVNEKAVRLSYIWKSKRVGIAEILGRAAALSNRAWKILRFCGKLFKKVARNFLTTCLNGRVLILVWVSVIYAARR